MIEEKVKVEIGVRERKYLGTIFGYEIFLEPEVMEALEEQYPDPKERDKVMWEMFDNMIPLALERYRQKERKKKK